MPTFDFACRKCGHTFEFTRPFGSKKEPAACPACKSKRIEKLLTPPSIQFKGSGFYKTDSTAPREKAPVKTPKESPPSTEKPAAKETTPAPKKDEKGV